MPERKCGDRIRFRVMPWVWPAGEIYEGIIVDVVDPDGDTYYHVNTMIGGKPIEGGMVFEREVIKE